MEGLKRGFLNSNNNNSNRRSPDKRANNNNSNNNNNNKSSGEQRREIEDVRLKIPTSRLVSIVEGFTINDIVTPVLKHYEDYRDKKVPQLDILAIEEFLESPIDPNLLEDINKPLNVKVKPGHTPGTFEYQGGVPNFGEVTRRLYQKAWGKVLIWGANSNDIKNLSDNPAVSNIYYTAFDLDSQPVNLTLDIPHAKQVGLVEDVKDWKVNDQFLGYYVARYGRNLRCLMNIFANVTEVLPPNGRAFFCLPYGDLDKPNSQIRTLAERHEDGSYPVRIDQSPRLDIYNNYVIPFSDLTYAAHQHGLEISSVDLNDEFVDPRVRKSITAYYVFRADCTCEEIRHNEILQDSRVEDISAYQELELSEIDLLVHPETEAHPVLFEPDPNYEPVIRPYNNPNANGPGSFNPYSEYELSWGDYRIRSFVDAFEVNMTRLAPNEKLFYRMAHGRPLNFTDMESLNADTLLVAKKWDGIHACVTYNPETKEPYLCFRNGLTLDGLGIDGRTLKRLRDIFQTFPDVKSFDIEIIRHHPTWNPFFIRKDRLDLKHCCHAIVFDVDCPGTMSRRLHRVRRIAAMLKWFYQTYYLFSTKSLAKCWSDSSCEGLVLIDANSSYYEKDGETNKSPARYLKRTPTIDVHLGEIIEAPLPVGDVKLWTGLVEMLDVCKALDLSTITTIVEVTQTGNILRTRCDKYHADTLDPNFFSSRHAGKASYEAIMELAIHLHGRHVIEQRPLSNTMRNPPLSIPRIFGDITSSSQIIGDTASMDKLISTYPNLLDWPQVPIAEKAKLYMIRHARFHMLPANRDVLAKLIMTAIDYANGQRKRGTEGD